MSEAELHAALERLVAATTFAMSDDAPEDAWVFVAGATVVARRLLEGSPEVQCGVAERAPQATTVGANRVPPGWFYASPRCRADQALPCETASSAAVRRAELVKMRAELEEVDQGARDAWVLLTVNEVRELMASPQRP
jgi:hypothetical protein